VLEVDLIVIMRLKFIWDCFYFQGGSEVLEDGVAALWDEDLVAWVGKCH
jgi:hypothetical protein